MPTFPYAGLPRHQVWKRAVSSIDAATIDPALPAKFRLTPSTRIGSAGSCFAVRIAAALRAAGYNYLVTEDGPAEQNYGTYSARFGDIYTSLQLLQLAQRAVGEFTPNEHPWQVGDRFHDPFRPRVQPHGFATLADLDADRRTHLAAVYRLFVQSEVFIFTMGLTETWCSRADGAAFPLCPGAGIGTFDADRYVFRNLDVNDNVAHLEAFLKLVWALNPSLRIVLTISPVPLAATMEGRHVVDATVYSKSVLRVVAEMLRRKYDQVEYFPSYEIVAAGFDGLDNYERDRREVAQSAVKRVMQSFFANFTVAGNSSPTSAPGAQSPGTSCANEIELDLNALATFVSAPRPAQDPCDEGYLATFIEMS